MMKQKPKTRRGRWFSWDPQWRFSIWYLVGALVLLSTWQYSLGRFSVRTIPYSEFKAALGRGEVTECYLREDEITGRIQPRAEAAQDGGTNQVTAGPAIESTNRAPGPAGPGAPAAKESKNEFLFRTIRVQDDKLVEELQRSGVKFGGVRPNYLQQFLLVWVLPLALLFLLWGALAKRMGAAGQSVLSIGKSRAKLVADRETGVTFADVAGCDEAKFELEEVADFLRRPDRYKALGAKIPKGLLLVGPPGTGKTLLARAVAGEARVPFFSLSGSDFVEMFVGVGAARVRDLFQQAKSQAPCIIFIDELDAVGRQRGVHIGAVNDEREQTLNQLLVEMDGFEANAGVILLAATNRPDVLDRALLRPGRFDRQVVLDAPDLPGREAILRVHAKGKPWDPAVDFHRIAQVTPGFSGADLANALNEAALLAARRKANRIGQSDLELAVEKVVAGPERKSRRLGEDEKRRVAYHEVGHALVAAANQHGDPVHKISIIPRGRAALGYTMQLPTEDQYLMTRTELKERLRGLLGGRAAEEIVYGEVTTGAQNDLEQATGLARQMVCLFGMGDQVGLAQCGRPMQSAFLGGGDGYFQRDCSEETARIIDEEVRRMLDQAYQEAREILQSQRQLLDQVAAELLLRETLDGPAFYSLIGKPYPGHPSAAELSSSPADPKQ
ncbi:MAG TPA: ATP-dependent zinc metalloprotease FtsH [Candidatus Paceibacterota bacterium]|nr:ATP-dependent zinc metalloprotease FtsH [Candidatus Paceibacterota bacterium]